MSMPQGSAFEKAEFIMCELLSQVMACRRHSINVLLSLFSHYSFQDPVLSVSENSVGEKLESRRGCLGSRSDASSGKHKYQIQPCAFLIPSQNGQASFVKGVSHGRQALQDSTAVQLPSAHHPALQGKYFCVCTFSSSWSRNVCLVSHTVVCHGIGSLMPGEFLLCIQPQRYIMGTQKWGWGIETLSLSPVTPWDFLSSQGADNITWKLILPFTGCMISGKAPPLSEL